MADEEWSSVIGWPEYEISSLGRVRTHHRRCNGRIIKPIEKKAGYLVVRFSRNANQYRVLVHHLVLEAFKEKRPPGKEANHINCDKQDNRPENLEWVTRSENMIHAVQNGRIKIPIRPRPSYIPATHCRNGHEYTTANTYITKKGIRHCRMCHKINAAKQRAAI